MMTFKYLLKENIPELAIGEFGLCIDSNEIFIGSSNGNVQIYPLHLQPSELLVSQLADVDAGSIQHGDVLVYNETRGQWLGVQPSELDLEGEDTSVPTPEPSGDLVFHVDFSGNAGSTDNIVFDTVHQLPSTLVNVAHDGTDGFLNDEGLTLQPHAYVSIPTNIDVVSDALDLNENGITIQFVAFDATGVQYRTNPAHMNSYISNVTNMGFRYIAEDGTERNYNSGHYWFADPYGEQSNMTTHEALHSSDELNVITVRYYPNGRCNMFINNRVGIEETIPQEFQRYTDMLSISELFIRRNYLGLNTKPTVLRAFSIYNKVLSDEQCLQQYEAWKLGESLNTVSVHPTEVQMNVGENRKLTVIATPLMYTNLISTTFESGNEGLVTVEADGTMTGVHAGNTIITVTSIYEDQTRVNRVPVRIGGLNLEPPATEREVTGISLNRQIDQLEVGESFSAMATALPFDVFNDNIVVWESSAPSVCSVNYGVLRAISEGTADIMVFDSSRKYTQSFTVTVVDRQESVVSDDNAYQVELERFNIHADHSNSMDTTRGIQAAMAYAKENNYRKIVFPEGRYLITPEAGTIYPPSELVIDFSGSQLQIEPSSLTTTGYTMFRFEHVANTKIVNAHIFGEADFTTVSDSVENCISFIISDAYRSGLENCTVSKSPGFNIATHNTVNRMGTSGTNVSMNNFEPGNLTADGSNEDETASNTFRSVEHMDVSGLGSYYMLGYTQGYFGYPHLRSRLYSIYFYDVNKQFINSHMYNLQYYNYDKPNGAHYAKIVIYQESPPTTEDTDFNAVALLRTVGMPTQCYIRNCKVEDNFSTGIALTGGQSWIIEGNSFSRNGGRMPNCDIDWEDGWEASVGDICRDNTFNSSSGMIISGGSSIAVLNNEFNQSHMHIWERTNNFRVYNNTFSGKGSNRNLNLGCQSDSCFAGNTLIDVNYSTLTYHREADYKVHTFNNTII